MDFGSSRYHVQDPALLEELRKYREQNAQLMNQYSALVEQVQSQGIRSMDDLEDHEKESFEALIRLSRNTQPVPMTGNNFAFFGLTSTGKSTIINRLLNKKVAKTGRGETTTTIDSYSGTHFVVWDLPGRNDDLSYFSMTYIAFLKALSRHVILVSHTIKEMSQLCKLLDALQLDYNIVVNKFDQLDDDEYNIFKNQIREEIEQLNLSHVLRDHLYFISAKYPQEFPDWLHMVDYLSSRPLITSLS